MKILMNPPEDGMHDNNAHSTAPFSVRTIWCAVIARITELRKSWDITTAELIVIAQAAWCWLVLQVNADYLNSSMRLYELQARAPEHVWQILFGFLTLWQLACVLVGGDAWPGGIANPFMATPARVRFWIAARIIGFWLGIGLNMVVMKLLSLNGIGFGTGYFLIAAACDLVGACKLSPLFVVEFLVEGWRQEKRDKSALAV